MKRWFLVLVILTLLFSASPSYGQCSICTKTAQQLGEKPAKALNGGILYLAFAPFAIVGFVAYKWWRSHKEDSK